MNKPWRPNDYIEKLPEYSIRPMVTPSVDLPRWFEPSLWTCIIALAITVLVLGIMSGYFAAHPVQS